jgi:hypothetical protein
MKLASAFRAGTIALAAPRCGRGASADDRIDVEINGIGVLTNTVIGTD